MRIAIFKAVVYVLVDVCERERKRETSGLENLSTHAPTMTMCNEED